MFLSVLANSWFLLVKGKFGGGRTNTQSLFFKLASGTKKFRTFPFDQHLLETILWVSFQDIFRTYLKLLVLCEVLIL